MGRNMTLGIVGRGTRALCGLALAIAAGSPAWAVYRVVGPDGTVTFTDVPPSGSTATRLPGLGNAAPPSAGQLPQHLLALQHSAPVVIYTTPQCQACEDGLHMLRERGIPYTQKSITSPRDAEAFKAIDPSLRVPLLSVAGVPLSPGFDSAAWSQALSAAGYPARSELPPGYHFAAPQPLVPPPAAPPGATGPGHASASSGQPPVVAPPNPNAPPGFKF